MPKWLKGDEKMKVAAQIVGPNVPLPSKEETVGETIYKKLAPGENPAAANAIEEMIAAVCETLGMRLDEFKSMDFVGDDKIKVKSKSGAVYWVHL